ncbi:MAG: hypothetical protein VKL59_13770 [Nostocaceae cyanobacterium]|nr:hypothetical protein [Nostocaceae cyanobacterium]
MSQSRLYARLFALPRGFKQFLEETPHPVQIMRFEKFAEATE